MRSLSPATLAAINGRLVPMCLLVEMDLVVPFLLNSASINLTLEGSTYLGTRGLGRIDAIRDTAAEVAQLRFELSGVPSTNVALALAEPVQGKAVRVKRAIFDPSTYQVLDVRLRWAGTLDVFALTDDPAGKTATITVTAEHSGIDLLRPATSLYTHLEQQRLAPGDLAFQYVSQQAEQRVRWPAAAYFRR